MAELQKRSDLYKKPPRSIPRPFTKQNNNHGINLSGTSTYNPLIEQADIKINPKLKQHLDDQDRNLDLMEQALGDLGKTAQEINEETLEQNKALDDLSSDVDNAYAKVVKVTEKTKRELTVGGMCGDCGLIPCIIFLVVIIIIGIILLIYV